MPTVSIIIPIYNVEPYIRQCLQSVMDQTLTEGIECILVDDCGQDKSIDIAQQMVDEYKGNIDFRIIHHEKNIGLSAARNTGIREAKGEWLYFLDSDDWIIPECIELMMETIRKYPDTQIVFAGTTVSTGEHNWLDYTRKTLPEYSKNKDWLQLSMLRRTDFGMTAWNKLISRTIIEKNKLLFQEGLIHEDELWNFQLAEHVTKAAFINSNTYFYRINATGIINSATEQIRWKRLMVLWNKMLYSIKGKQTSNQARGLCGFMFQKTSQDYPKRYKKDISRILISSSFKMSFPYNVYTLALSVLNFLNWRRFPTDRLRSRVRLPRM